LLKAPKKNHFLKHRFPRHYEASMKASNRPRHCEPAKQSRCTNLIPDCFASSQWRYYWVFLDSNKKICNHLVWNSKVTNPKVTNQKVTNPKVTNQKVTNPKVTNQKVTNKKVTNYLVTIK